MTIQHQISRPIIEALTLLTLLFTSTLVLADDALKSGDAARGGQIWAENCARCHNMRSPSDLTDEQWIASVAHMRIRAGLTGQEARDVLAFLQASNGQEPTSGVIPVSNTVAAVEAADGKAVYDSSCIACHGANGKGAIPGVPDFTAADSPLSKPREVLLNNIINGVQTPGNSMPMPPRGGNATLTDEEVAAALDYITKSFKP